jgi:hypothetical protein
MQKKSSLNVMPVPIQPMEVVEYAAVAPPALVPEDPQSIANLRTQVTLQTQGDPAIFDAKTPQTALVLAFAAACDAATQAILRLEDGRAVLLFDHETRQLIPQEPMEESVSVEIKKLRGKISAAEDVAAPTPEKTVDLAAMWSESGTSEDVVTNTKLFLKRLVLALKPAMILRLQGDIPALPLLAALYLARPSGRAVEHQNNAGTIAVLFQ